MFKITKATNKSSNIFEALKDLGLTVQDKNSLDYLNQVSQQGLFDLEVMKELKPSFRYDETDIKFEEAEVLGGGTILISETLEGTDFSEEFVIGQRPDFRGHEQAIYGTDIRAGGGNDTIIGDHSGYRPASSIEVWGEDGIDHFVSTQRNGSLFQIKDMEVGETFTTHEDFYRLKLISENERRKVYGVNCDLYDYGHGMIVDPGTTILQTLDSDGNHVYICVPEA